MRRPKINFDGKKMEAAERHHARVEAIVAGAIKILKNDSDSPLCYGLSVSLPVAVELLQEAQAELDNARKFEQEAYRHIPRRRKPKARKLRAGGK